MHKILSTLLLVTISSLIWGQSVTLSVPETFGGDESCYYIQSVALDAQNAVVFYSGSDGTKVRNINIENGTISYGNPLVVSYGTLSIDGVNRTSQYIKDDELAISKKENILDVPLKIVRNSSDSFILFYEDDKNPGSNVARFGTLQNGVLNLGNEYVFGANGIVGVNGFDAINLNNGQFLMAYNNDESESLETDNQIGHQVASISPGDLNTTIAFSDFLPISMKGIDASDLSIAKISNTQFVIAYINRVNNSKGEYVVGTMVDNSIELSPVYTFSSLDLSGVKAIGLGNNKFVINYGVDNVLEFSKDYGYSLLGEVSGAGIDALVQFSDPYIFNPDGCSNYDMDGVALTNDAFILFWSNGSITNSNRFAVGKLVNNDIVFDKNVDDQLPEIAYPSVSLMSPDNLLFSYQNQSSSQFLGKNVFVNTQSLIPDLVESLIVPTPGTPTNDEKLTTSNFRLYPTITTGTVKIELENAKGDDVSIKIFDMTSKMIYSKKTQNNSVELNFDEFDKGMYLVSVQVGTSLLTKKIIKQ
ncbi:MAG: T9SS type A sorting domain-containing protein [Carboxylicivirga sp.]|jgi:hypothetical protein|nr:T9SS type A sorting domain-containing protein [Carboxylicivirga sp.]